MSETIHGTCGRCGGCVTTPQFWGGTMPPIPTCKSCGARVKQPFGAVLPMEDAPKAHPVYPPLDGDVSKWIR